MKKEYTYTFATGETITLTKEHISEEWVSVLMEMDRVEYNNEHAETRRHCSLDFIDPDGCIFETKRDGFDEFEKRETWREMKKKLTCRESLIAEFYFIEGFRTKEIADEFEITVRRVEQILRRIRKKLKNFSK